MPVTARLSKAFYDKLGEQVANELVEWFNLVDLTYRSELRELNELNFARFDAKVGERLAELRSDLRTELHTELAKLRSELHDEIAEVRSSLSNDLRDTKVSLIRWMFAFWVGTALAVAGARLVV